MEGQSTAPAGPVVYAHPVPHQPQQPQPAYAPNAFYSPPLAVPARKPFPSSPLSIALILTVIGCIIGAIVVGCTTPDTNYDGMPSSCCAQAGGSLNWQVSRGMQRGGAGLVACL